MISNETFRSALTAYVQTFSSRERLVAFIASHHLEAQSEEITNELTSLIKTAEDHLYDFPGGVPWTDKFKEDYEQLLVSRHPWMDRSSLDCIMSFSGWLCWHEGLNAKET